MQGYFKSLSNQAPKIVVVASGEELIWKICASVDVSIQVLPSFFEALM